jgi:hypothetical protein
MKEPKGREEKERRNDKNRKLRQNDKEQIQNTEQNE